MSLAYDAGDHSIAMDQRHRCRDAITTDQHETSTRLLILRTEETTRTTVSLYALTVRTLENTQPPPPGVPAAAMTTCVVTVAYPKEKPSALE